MINLKRAIPFLALLGTAACAPEEFEVNEACFPEDTNTSEVEGIPITVSNQYKDPLQDHLTFMANQVGGERLYNSINSITVIDASRPGCSARSRKEWKGWTDLLTGDIVINTSEKTKLELATSPPTNLELPLPFDDNPTQVAVGRTLLHEAGHALSRQGYLGTQAEWEKNGLFSPCEVNEEGGYVQAGRGSRADCFRTIHHSVNHNNVGGRRAALRDEVSADAIGVPLSSLYMVRQNQPLSPLFEQSVLPYLKENPAMIPYVRAAWEERGINFNTSLAGHQLAALGDDLWNRRIRYLTAKGIFNPEDASSLQAPKIYYQLTDLFRTQQGNELAELDALIARGTQ